MNPSATSFKRLLTRSERVEHAGMSQLLDLFPLGSATDADGMLIIGGCRADDLAAEFGTPVLVVAEEALRARAREYADELTSRWPNSRVVFASKAFPCTAVQRVMVEEGLGLDVAGGGEILTALKAGVDPALIVLHGNAKTTEESPWRSTTVSVSSLLMAQMTSTALKRLCRLDVIKTYWYASYLA